MNAREQYLQKQNQRLQNQVHFLLDVIDRMGLEHDFLGSIACGFAWDLQNDYSDYTVTPLSYWEQRIDQHNRATQLSQELRAD